MSWVFSPDSVVIPTVGWEKKRYSAEKWCQRRVGSELGGGGCESSRGGRDGKSCAQAQLTCETAWGSITHSLLPEDEDVSVTHQRNAFKSFELQPVMTHTFHLHRKTYFSSYLIKNNAIKHLTVKPEAIFVIKMVCLFPHSRFLLSPSHWVVV